MDSYTHILKEKYKGQVKPGFSHDLRRLEYGEPLSYVIGSTPFLNTTIDVSKRPFLPRVETEFWVHKALSGIDSSKKLTCLDIFSGSGCIGIALLKSLEGATVTLAEQNPEYIEQIKINLKINSIGHDRAKLLKSNVFSNVQGKYDFIFANPPYISKERHTSVEPSVLKFEPRSALFAPDNGLFYIKKLLKEAPSYLKPSGTLFIEFDSWQKKDIENYAKQLQLQFKYKHIEFWRDQYKKWRVLKMVT